MTAQNSLALPLNRPSRWFKPLQSDLLPLQSDLLPLTRVPVSARSGAAACPAPLAAVRISASACPSSVPLLRFKRRLSRRRMRIHRIIVHAVPSGISPLTSPGSSSPRPSPLPGADCRSSPLSGRPYPPESRLPRLSPPAIQTARILGRFRLRQNAFCLFARVCHHLRARLVRRNNRNRLQAKRLAVLERLRVLFVVTARLRQRDHRLGIDFLLQHGLDQQRALDHLPQLRFRPAQFRLQVRIEFCVARNCPLKLCSSRVMRAGAIVIFRRTASWYTSSSKMIIWSAPCRISFSSFFGKPPCSSRRGKREHFAQ